MDYLKYFEEIVLLFFSVLEYIQISQCPGRGEPSTPGEINYDYIFPLIQGLGYTGYIGLEYHPAGNGCRVLLY